MFELWLAPYVVASRLPRLMFEAQRLALGQAASAAGRPEAERMITEKVAAMQEGMMAMAFEGVRTGFAAGIAAASGNVPRAAETLAEAPRKLARAALRPAGRSVKANARRLTRRQRG